MPKNNDYQGIKNNLTRAEQAQRAKILKDIEDKPNRERREAIRRTELSYAYHHAKDDVTRCSLLVKAVRKHPITPKPEPKAIERVEQLHTHLHTEDDVTRCFFSVKESQKRPVTKRWGQRARR